MNINEDFFLIRYKYDEGWYSLNDIFNFVTEGVLEKEDFHLITGYDYDGVKKTKGLA